MEKHKGIMIFASRGAIGRWERSTTGPTRNSLTGPKRGLLMSVGWVPAIFSKEILEQPQKSLITTVFNRPREGASDFFSKFRNRPRGRSILRV